MAVRSFRNKFSVLPLLLVFGLGSVVAPNDVYAATKRQKAAVKKSVKVSAKSSSKRLVAATPAKRAALKSKMRAIPDVRADGTPNLMSSSALVLDQRTGAVLYEKNPDSVVPIASITKLMTAMVVLDARLPMSDRMEIAEDDIDTLKNTRSRLAVGAELSREEMLWLALMSSENRAASALSRYYPGGQSAFIAAMNRKAASLGLMDTRFFDSTGLNSGNVSSPRDLAKMVAAAGQYPVIRELSTSSGHDFVIKGRERHFVNTNALVSNPDWQISVSKTGFTNEAGKCLVMQAWLNQRPLLIVLMDSWGKMTRVGDAIRIKRWLESNGVKPLASAAN